MTQEDEHGTSCLVQFLLVGAGVVALAMYATNPDSRPGGNTGGNSSTAEERKSNDEPDEQQKTDLSEKERIKKASLESGIWESYLNLNEELKVVTVEDLHVQTNPPDVEVSRASRATVIVDARDTGSHIVGAKLNWDTESSWDKGEYDVSFGPWKLRNAEAIVKPEKVEDALKGSGDEPK